MGAVAQRHDQGQISFERTNDSTLVVQFSGPWHLQRDLPPVSLLLSELASRPGTKRLSFDTAQHTHRDSGLIAFLTNMTDICRARGIAEDCAGLPAGLRRLLELAEAVPEKKGARSEPARISFFERVWNKTLSYGLRRVIELNQHRTPASTDSNAALASRPHAELIKTCSL